VARSVRLGRYRRGRIMRRPCCLRRVQGTGRSKGPTTPDVDQATPQMAYAVRVQVLGIEEVSTAMTVQWVWVEG
jgi:hypothetical protein